jgi:hypothetical protein
VFWQTSPKHALKTGPLLGARMSILKTNRASGITMIPPERAATANLQLLDKTSQSEAGGTKTEPPVDGTFLEQSIPKNERIKDHEQHNQDR